MSQEKKSTVGEPIWVESLMSSQELQEAHRLYPNTVRSGKHFEYDPSRYKGGTWRAGMGMRLTPAEIALFNHNFEKLTNLLKTKKFQKRPDYGTHAEAKP
jgi:hypothetical protein